MISASKIIDATFNPVSLYVKTKYRNKENKKTILQELFGKLGHNHEDAIYDFLCDKYGEDKIYDFNREYPNIFEDRQKLLKKTIKKMKKYPIIFEAYICSEELQMMGYIDILMRISIFIDLFENILPIHIISDLKEEYKKYGDFHMILDMKYSSIKRMKDYSLSRAKDKYKYLIQLNIYNKMLKEIQPYVSQYSWIWGSRVKGYDNNNVLHAIAFYDHNDLDLNNEINNIIFQAITFINNMDNYIEDYKKIKDFIKSDMFDPDYINEYKKKCREELKIEILSETHSSYITQIDLGKFYEPLLLTRNNKYTLFIDNESVNSYHTNDFDTFPYYQGVTGAYMIGVIGYQNGEEIFREQFIAEELTTDGIFNVHKGFNDLIMKLGTENINSIIHFAPAEIHDFKAFIRNEDRSNELEFFKNFRSNKSLFLDLRDVIRKIAPLTNGDGFGLKPVSKYFYDLELIKTKYDDINGLLTIPLIIKFYEDTDKNAKILEDISIYNYKDCIVLKELVELLLVIHENNNLNNLFDELSL